ncbi:exoribonuclease Rex4 [Hyaloraphidium curvatum]|nr:exoribonuclease Rex4 [Hyaloraphidium curvatum]
MASSNWKALAAQLKSSAPPRKRKDHAKDGSGHAGPKGAPVPNGGPPTKKRKAEEPAAPAAKQPKLDDLWFDDVNEEDIRAAYGLPPEEKRAEVAADGAAANPVSEVSLNKIGKYVAMDCEMVGVGDDGERSVLARVSIVNFHGQVVLDRYVRPVEFVQDFRTHVSGIRKFHLRDAIPLRQAQEEVAAILKDRIVVGHALANDFDVLLLSHPHRMVRDTAQYRPFRKEFGKGRTPGLRKLAKGILGLEIQGGEHSSIEDARAAMLIYKSRRDEWEASLRVKGGNTGPEREGRAKGAANAEEARPRKAIKKKAP